MAVSHIKSDTIADFTGTFTGFNSQGSTTTIAATDVVRPSDWNSIHNQFYTLTGNTTNQSTASGTNVVLAGSGGITLGGSTGSIVISALPKYTASHYEAAGIGSVTNVTHANGNAYFSPLFLNSPLKLNKILMLQSFSTQSNTTYTVSASVSSQTSTGISGSWGHSGTYGLFSRKNTDPTQADYSRILSFISGTYTFSYGISASVSWSTNASSVTASLTTSGAGGFISQINTAGAITTSSSTSSGSTTFSSTSTNQNSFSSQLNNTFGSVLFSGMRPIYLPVASTILTEGEYWFMHIPSSNSGATNNTRFDRFAAQMEGGMVVVAGVNQSYLNQGSTGGIATTNLQWGLGSHNASSNSTTTMGLTSITSYGSNATQWLIMNADTL